MDQPEFIYLCPICFRVCESEAECHEHQMVICVPGHPGDERRKPVSDQFGNFVSRAPRWYLEALSQVRES
jgi:hypothetical protein